MGRYLFVLSAALVGLALGVGSAWLAIERLASGARVAVDGWSGTRTAGDPGADLYVRAAIARHGLFALPADQALYLSRATDAEGAPLSDACAYRISGSALPATWWSLTLYDETGFLARNEDEAHSTDATRALWSADGRWEALVGPVRAPGTWLSTAEAGRFSLLLRLYRPNGEALADPQSIAVPKIERITCMDEDDPA